MEDKPNTHRLDKLGRIVIPEQLRTELGWNVGDRMEIEAHSGDFRSVTIRPLQLRCSLCRQVCDEIQSIGCGAVCPACIEVIKNG